MGRVRARRIVLCPRRGQPPDQRFDSQRSFVRAWGPSDRIEGQFSDPVGLAVGPGGNVHVLDDIRAVIETYDADGTVLRTIPAFPPGGPPRCPANGLSIGPNGHFYVNAIGPSQVIELDRDGTLVATYGAPVPARERSMSSRT